MTTKHSTCVFCDGGDGLMVERRDDGLFIYAVPPFLRYVSQNLIFAILTRIFEVFQDAANDADACFPSSTKTWFSVWRPKNCKIGTAVGILDQKSYATSPKSLRYCMGLL